MSKKTLKTTIFHIAVQHESALLLLKAAYEVQKTGAPNLNFMDIHYVDGVLTVYGMYQVKGNSPSDITRRFEKYGATVTVIDWDEL